MHLASAAKNIINNFKNYLFYFKIIINIIGSLLTPKIKQLNFVRSIKSFDEIYKKSKKIKATNPSFTVLTETNQGCQGKGKRTKSLFITTILIHLR